MAKKTFHVIPQDRGWAVVREGTKKPTVLRTQQEAIAAARVMVRHLKSGQVVVHGRNGKIRSSETYGLPRIQDAPGKQSARIARAVSAITGRRLNPLPSRA